MLGPFPSPPPGGRTYCPTDVFSYTSQVPTQPHPTAPAAHPLLCFTPNSMLLLLGATPLCRWAWSHLFSGDFTPGQQCPRHETADTWYLITQWGSPTLLLRGQLAASGRAISKTGSPRDGVQATLGCRGCSTAPQSSPAHPGTTTGLQHQLQTQPGLINQIIYPAPLWAFHPTCAEKGGKGLYWTFSPYQVSRKSSGWSGCISRWVNHGSLWSSTAHLDCRSCTQDTNFGEI